jgi:hypothetical protein
MIEILENHFNHGVGMMTENRAKQNILQDDSSVVGEIFDTPITAGKFTWIPLTQLIVWLIFIRRAAKNKPDKTTFSWTVEGLLKMIVMLGSEWCHNLSHAFSAKVVGKPMDQMKIQMGMPRCVYYELNDQEITPRQHIIRSLGGPIFNAILVPITAILRLFTRPRSIARETLDTAFHTNLFLSVVSLLPIPGIDGGPILKWSLVEKGYKIREADEIVRNTNGPLSIILGLFSSWAFSKKKILAGVFSGMLGLISLSVFAGWLKEEDVGL